jgi:hypothetical protein
VTDDDLSRTIRETYSRAMKTHPADCDAISECVAILMQHRPEIADDEARKVIARMIAEQPRI